MNYLIYNENEELLDIVDFENNSIMESYRKNNPKFIIKPADELENDFLILEGEDLENLEDESDLPW